MLPALAAVGMAGWLGSWDFLPPGPAAEDPGFGAGSDWDIQWEMAGVSHAALRAGELPHWDPYPAYGVPLLANPEAFSLHPAWLAGAIHSPRTGLRALFAFQCLLLLLGSWWLGRSLGVPWFLALACGLAPVASAEWRDRLYNGHLMVLGMAAWPACLAAVMAACADTRRKAAWTSVLLGAAGGAALGLASLGGGHYPLAFGLLAALLLVWSTGAPMAARVALVGLLAVPLVVPVAPAGARWVVVLAGAAVLALGVARSDRRGAQLRCGAGIALGLLAVSGVRLVPQMVMLAASGRRAGLDLAPPPVAALPLFQPWLAPERILEGYLSMSPFLLAALLLGLVALWRASPPLAVVGLGLWLLAWGSGRPLQPWELAAVVPGMSSINSPLRLQWIVLVLGPLGLAAGAMAAAGRWLPRPGRTGAAVALAVLAWFVFDTPGSPPFEGDPAPRAYEVSRAVLAVGDDDPAAFLSRRAGAGQIDPLRGTALAFPPLDSTRADGLAWIEEACRPLPGDLEVDASLGDWTVRAPAGAQIAIAQRDVPGWSCDGGKRVDAWCDDGPEGPAPPGRGGRWLRLRMGEDGSARCRWRSPGRTTGVVLQLAALVALIAGSWLGRRGSRGTAQRP